MIQMIEDTERRGYQVATVNIGNGKEVIDTEYRNSSRCIVDDFDLAAEVWDVIRSAIPETFEFMVASRVNERFRFLKYDPGEFFKPHFESVYLLCSLIPEKTLSLTVAIQRVIYDS